MDQGPPAERSQAVLTVDLGALADNWRALAKRVAPAECGAVVKADAYGHGVVRVARALGEDVDALGVACVEEAVALREAGISRPIVLLEGPFEARELSAIVVHDLESVVHNEQQLAWFTRHDANTTLWIKFDTGMHRLTHANLDQGHAANRCQRL